MSTQIPWSTAISNGGTGSYTGVPSASFMCKQSMKKPRKESSNPQSASNSSSEGSINNGHQEDNIPAAASRYEHRRRNLGRGGGMGLNPSNFNMTATSEARIEFSLGSMPHCWKLLYSGHTPFLRSWLIFVGARDNFESREKLNDTKSNLSSGYFWVYFVV
jgi:hypothetical protein